MYFEKGNLRNTAISITSSALRQSWVAVFLNLQYALCCVSRDEFSVATLGCFQTTSCRTL